MQSNTKVGARVFTGGEDLTGKEGYLAEIRNSSGSPRLHLPDAITDDAYFLLLFGGASGADSEAKALHSGENVRIKLKGTCNPGTRLVLADPSTAADKGKVRALPATAGTYNVIAIAEEAGVDGQLVLCRPYPVGNVTVS